MTHEIELLVQDTRNQFESVLVDKTMSFDREAEFAIQAIFKSDYNLKLARNNQQSVRDAMSRVAAMGLTLNPEMKLAYLAPRENKLQLIVSYMGLVHVAIDSGVVRFARAELVYANDVFELNGVDKEPTHKFPPFAKPGARGELVGAYCVAKTAHGDYLTDWMVIEDIWKIRERSDSWKAHVKEGKKSPWATDESEMIKKTVIKRAYKLWPKAEGSNPERLAHVIDHMNTNTGEGIDFSEAPKMPAFKVGEHLKAIKFAKTMEELNMFRRAGQKAASDAGLKWAYDEISDAARKRKQFLSDQTVTDVQEKKK